MDKQQAYQSLWGRFGIPAYEENSVPDEAKAPYITYQVLLDDLDAQVFPTASLWYRGSSWNSIDAKLAEISRELSNISPIPLDEGFMYVSKNTPWAQRSTDNDDRSVKRYILNLIVEFLTNM